jgi:hypothetical protein
MEIRTKKDARRAIRQAKRCYISTVVCEGGDPAYVQVPKTVVVRLLESVPDDAGGYDSCELASVWRLRDNGDLYVW